MHKRNITTRPPVNVITNANLAMAVIALGAFGCAQGSGSGNGNGNGSTEADSSALKAASPACASARDACKTSIEALLGPVQSACAPLETACDHHAGGGNGGATGSTGAAGAAGSDDCATARAACKAAFVAILPQVEQAGKACEQSIDDACTIPRPDGGAAQGSAGRGGEARGGRDGHERPPESAACEDAEDACRTSLASLRSMPPASCAAVESACSGQTPSTATDACKTAFDTCRADAEAAAKAAHEGCGTSIVAACGTHGG